MDRIDINPDGLDDDDLRELLAGLRTTVDICSKMLRARELRADGEIQPALAHERDIDKLYTQLPDWIRW